MCDPCAAHGIPRGMAIRNPWVTLKPDGQLMGNPWATNGLPMGNPWATHGQPMGSYATVHDQSMGDPWCALGLLLTNPWDTHALPSWATHGRPMSAWAAHALPTPDIDYYHKPTTNPWATCGLAERSHDQAMGDPCATHGQPMSQYLVYISGCKRQFMCDTCTYNTCLYSVLVLFAVDNSWATHGLPVGAMDNQRLPIGYTWADQGLLLQTRIQPMGDAWATYGLNPWAILWAAHGSDEGPTGGL